MDASELRNVVKVECSGKSILLTGDTVGRLGNEKEDAAGLANCLGAEEWMVENERDLLDGDILVGQRTD